MHEFSICQSLVEAVQAELAKVRPPPRRLLKAGVAVGALRQVVPAYLVSAYEILARGTVLEGSTLEIRTVSPEYVCESCGLRSGFSAGPFECPGCGSGKGIVSGGRELYLDRIEVEHED